ncbi:hypothetical protein SFUMM280S_03233 [Streptomyces fumanus]
MLKSVTAESIRPYGMCSHPNSRAAASATGDRMVARAAAGLQEERRQQDVPEVGADVPERPGEFGGPVLADNAVQAGQSLGVGRVAQRHHPVQQVQPPPGRVALRVRSPALDQHAGDADGAEQPQRREQLPPHPAAHDPHGRALERARHEVAREGEHHAHGREHDRQPGPAHQVVKTTRNRPFAPANRGTAVRDHRPGPARDAAGRPPGCREGARNRATRACARGVPRGTPGVYIRESTRHARYPSRVPRHIRRYRGRREEGTWDSRTDGDRSPPDGTPDGRLGQQPTRWPPRR